METEPFDHIRDVIYNVEIQHGSLDFGAKGNGSGSWRELEFNKKGVKKGPLPTPQKDTRCFVSKRQKIPASKCCAYSPNHAGDEDSHFSDSSCDSDDTTMVGCLNKENGDEMEDCLEQDWVLVPTCVPDESREGHP